MKYIGLACALGFVFLGAGCASAPPAVTPPVTVPVVPPQGQTTSTAQTKPDTATVLAQLSSQWQKDGGELQAYSGRVDSLKGSLSACPDLPQHIDVANAHLASSTAIELYAIPNHACSAALRVFLRCDASMEDSANPQWIQVGNGWYWCSDWKATLILEDQATHAQSLGDLSVVRGGNFGGLFMPIAFTKDNQQIVLDAWMFSPGAGGGSVDLGYDIMPATGTVATEQKQQLVPRQAKFYDTFGEVVFLGNSKNLPGFSQPGPSSNLGTVMAEDLITGKTKLVLEEPDTTYDLLDINEAKGTLHFRATKHQFTAACPKREDALDCTKNTVAERTIPLPTF